MVHEDRRGRLRRAIGPADPAAVDLALFRGPLVVLDSGPGRSPGDPLDLGGDLHALHPDGRPPGAPADRDPSLDRATITFFDGDGRLGDLPATEGRWSARLEGEAPDRALFLLLTDGHGRPRIWLLLPPARTMIGIAHLWLPRVPPPADRPPP